MRRYTRLDTVEMRRLIVAAKNANPVFTVRQLAAMFGIGKSSVERYLKNTHCPRCGRPYAGTNEGRLIGTNEGHE